MSLSRRTLIASAALTAGFSPGLISRARAATTLRWATVLPVSHPSVAMMNKVAKDVAEATGGAVMIETFPSGQLGSSRDLIEATSAGAVQMVDEGAAQFGQFVPAFSILEAPYIWKDPAQIRRVLGSSILDDMNKQLAGSPKRNSFLVWLGNRNRV